MELVPLAPWSAFFMLVVAVLCLVGLLSRTFKDNLFQNIGMTCGLIGCSSRFADLLGRTDIPLDWFLVHACMGFFAMGVAWKILRIEHKAKFDALRDRLYVHNIAAAKFPEHDHILK